MMLRSKLARLASVSVGMVSAVAASAAVASESQFRVPAGTLRGAVMSYIHQSGEEVIFRADEVHGITTEGLSGRYSHDVALQLLLRNTGFEARRDSSGAIVIFRPAPAVAFTQMANVTVTQAPAPAHEHSAQHSAHHEPLEEVVVTGSVVGKLGLQQESASASRLGLSLMETPAAVEMLDSELMQARGYQEVSDALSKLPGVTAGDRSSATFWGSFAMRGFERAQLTLLRDGIWLGPATMVMRQQNTFNLDRIEVLRGPASVLNGNGAIAGTINTVNKSARVTDETRFNALASYGRYDAYNAGLGVEGPAGGNLYYRADVSYFVTDSFVPNSDAYSTNFTGSLLWQPSDSFSLKLAYDYLKDDGPDYWGTPLVPASVARDPMDVVRTSTGHVLDRAMRFKNYNIEDGYSKADQSFVRLEMDWDASDSISVKNVLYGYKADRSWLNADGGVYCDPSLANTFPCIGPEHQGQVQRYNSYFGLEHDQEQFGDRFTVNFDVPIGERSTRWVLGAEFNDIDFVRTNAYRISAPLVDEDSVDPYNPVPGDYGPLEPRATSPTYIQNRAVFAEGMIEIFEPLKLVAAARYEELDIERSTVSLVPGPNYMRVEDQWSRTYEFWSYRVGLVYEISDGISAYGQISTAADPVGQNLFISTSRQNFDLTDANLWEVGLKATMFSGKAEATLAYFDIKRDDITEAYDRDSVQLIGARTSRGVELSTTFSPTGNLDLGFSAAYTDALILPSPNAVAVANNRPANVPEWTASAYVHYQDVAGLPIDVGAGARYIDERFADHRNTALMSDYTIVDLFVGWAVRDNMRLSVRMDNAFDEEFIPWSAPAYFNAFAPGGFIYSNQLSLGSPRTYGVTIEAQF